MKLSVELSALTDKFGDFKAVELAKKAGFDAVDYSFYWNNEKEEVLGDTYIEYAKKLREHLDAVGIKCNQAHAPFSMGYGCAFNTSDKKYLWLTHAIESAAILGAENIIVHALTVPKGVNFESYNIDYYKSLIPYCEKFGIRVAVENLFAVDTKRKRLIGKLGSPEELSGIVEKIASPWITACVDVGHASLTGYEPEEFIEKMKPGMIKALHIQDNDYVSDRHVVPFTGEINWSAVMAALKNVGYDGDLTFEIFNFLKKLPDALIPDGLSFAASVGRYLISLSDN